MSVGRTKSTTRGGHNDVAVGFSLSTHYGYAQRIRNPLTCDLINTSYISLVACRHADGSVTDIARVDASQQYKNLIKRLSLDAAAHPSPPYRKQGEWEHDLFRQIVRRTRKAIGLPASSDVGLLARLMQQLRETAESHLSQSIDAVVISYPTLTGLYVEAINDAADYVGLRVLTGFSFYQPRNVFAAYAGHGMGICDQRGGMLQCRKELSALPVRDVLLAECTSTAMLLHVRRIRAAIDTADPDVTAFADFDDQNDSSSPYDPSRLVHSVTQVLEEYYRFKDRPKEITVVVSGNRGDDSLVTKIISEAVRSFGPEPDMLTKEALFISARGAAQLAWLASDDQTAEMTVNSL
ncbi:MAG: hypothetical protein Q9160_009043 [Pyrenula sp. 1 TL-2023]